MASGFDQVFPDRPCFRDRLPRTSPGEFYRYRDVVITFRRPLPNFEVLMVRIFRELSSKTIVADVFPALPTANAWSSTAPTSPTSGTTSRWLTSDLFAQSEFKVFRGAVDQGGAVKVINACGAAAQPRKFFDDAEAFAKQEGPEAPLIALRDGEMKGPAAVFSDAEKQAPSRKPARKTATSFGAGVRAGNQRPHGQGAHLSRQRARPHRRQPRVVLLIVDFYV